MKLKVDNHGIYRRLFHDPLWTFCVIQMFWIYTLLRPEIYFFYNFKSFSCWFIDFNAKFNANTFLWFVRLVKNGRWNWNIRFQWIVEHNLNKVLTPGLNNVNQCYLCSYSMFVNSQFIYLTYNVEIVLSFWWHLVFIYNVFILKSTTKYFSWMTLYWHEIFRE